MSETEGIPGALQSNALIQRLKPQTPTKRTRLRRAAAVPAPWRPLVLPQRRDEKPVYDLGVKGLGATGETPKLLLRNPT